MTNPSTTLPPDFGPVEGERAVLVVGNPTSRGGKAAARFPKIQSLMKSHRISYDFRHTSPGGGTSEMVCKAVDQEGFRTIVYVGGDGTFSEVAKGICRSGRPREVRIGMIPSGTANDQGKSFGISSNPRSLEKNLQTIASGHTTRLDVGEVTARSDREIVLRRDLFFDSAGWGLSAAILSFRNRELEIVRKLPVVRDMYRDHTVYVRAAAHELALSWLTRDRFKADIQIDGNTINLDGLTDLVVSNTAVYAGEWIIDPESKHNDGRLEVAAFRGVRDWTSRMILNHKKFPITEEMFNRIGISHSPVYTGSRIKLSFVKPNPTKRLLAQLDGEEFPPAHSFEIRVHKGMLNLIVPENHHWI